ncbi:MAG: ABC transporter substrate-binding protein [Acidimicrobiales bacterium]
MPKGNETASANSRPKRRSRGAVLVVALLAVLSLFAAACGGGRSDSSGGSDTTAKSTATSFGTLDSPCGAGEAKGATQQGVTDTAITIGYGDDAGYPAAPGLNKEMSDAMKAMIKWCNDQGGINGRQIEGKYYDAAIMEANNRMTEACTQVFMLVGQGFSLDSVQEQTRLGCKMASVPTYSVSAAFANGEYMVQAVPNPIDKTPLSGAYQMAELFPAEVQKAAIFTANYAATKDSTDKAKTSFTSAGWKFLDCEQLYNIGGESNWTPFVQRLKDCGAEVVFFSGSPAPNFQNVLDASKAIGFSPKWYTDSNFYDPSLAKWNTNGNADNVYVRVVFYPFEQASQHPATQKYLDLLKASGGKTGLLGAQATTNFLLWASAAQECGSTLTSDCILGKLKAITEWDGGGLHANANPGANLPPDCGMLVKLKGTDYEQVAPKAKAEMECSPKFIGSVTGPVVDAAKLDANRISRAAG